MRPPDRIKIKGPIKLNHEPRALQKKCELREVQTKGLSTERKLIVSLKASVRI